jgi:hypothetical protein
MTPTLWLLVASFVIFALAMLAIGIGVLLGGRPVRGSCGGAAIRDARGELLNCSACPARERLGEPGAPPPNSTLPGCDEHQRCDASR